MSENDMAALGVFIEFVRLNPSIPSDSPIMVKVLEAYRNYAVPVPAPA